MRASRGDRTPATRSPRPAGSASRQRSPFPIVGVGASAGGLEAFRQLLKPLPGDPGMAFVLLQHLSPDHGSALVELLAACTPMRVCEIVDGMTVEANHVYVIPPDRDVALSAGRLVLVPRTTAHGLHMPVDHFLRSLAEERQDAAIAVILSGTGSDGTLGVKAVKGEGGITFAQEPGSAAHDGMPRSAIASGSVDLVLPAPAIARELARLGRHPYVAAAGGPGPRRGVPKPPSRSDGPRGLGRVLSIIRKNTGADFAAYKQTTIGRRVLRRMALANIDGIDEYARHLEGRPEEVQALAQDCLITVTSFFRDPAVFEALGKNVLPPLLKDRGSKSAVRAWVPGCATGEEAYSIAICLLEAAAELLSPSPLQVFATDISESALDKARSGTYLDTIAQDVSPERLRRFFTRTNGGYQVNKAVRELCVFARHDMIKDPPFSRLDLVSCRNVLIYLEPDLQQRLLATFHYALNPLGILILGSAETVGPLGDQFSLVDKQQRIYSRNDAGAPRAFTWAASATRPAGRAEPSAPPRSAISIQAELPAAADRALLARYAPAGVIVDSGLTILEFRGETSPYLEHPQGQAGLGLLRMARKGLLHDVRKAVDDARRTGAPARRAAVPLREGRRVRRVDVEAIPLADPTEGEHGLLVTFKEHLARADVEPARPLASRGGSPRQPVAQLARENAELRAELQESGQHLHRTMQEHERANEELQSANEEVLSANEELQSINEELETAKEEVQSANEELSTVNQELQERNRQLGSVNDDLLNLLTSVNIPLVIVGRDLRLRRFTPAAERLFGLIHTDVGRPLGDLRSTFDTPALEADVLETIDTMEAREREVTDRERRFHLLQVRPYRTREDKIDGAVIVLFDIDGLKRALADANAIVDTAREPLVILDADLRVERANRSLHELFASTSEGTEGRLLHELGDGQWVSADLRRTLQRVLPNGVPVDDYVLEHDFPGMGRRTMVLSARKLHYAKGGKDRILLAIEDRTQAHLAAQERERALALETEARRRAEEADRVKDEFVATLSHELRGPLTSISGWVHVLTTGRADEAVAARALEAIDRGVNAQARMIEELLDYSRMTKGKLRMAQGPIDLVAVTGAAMHAVKAAAAAKEIAVGLSSEPEPAVILGDPDRLQQIAWNLLSNAVKFTPRGGRVDVAVSRVDGQVELSVSDTGKGISAAFLPHVFERFRQAEGRPSRTEHGLGLGLAIVRNLVELHGGCVHAESPGEGGGATFTVTFPVPALMPDSLRAAESPRAGAGDAETTASAASGGVLEGVRILVVEDDVDSRQMLVAIFEQSGAIVRHAGSVPEALAALDEAVPDVLTCDVGLPGEDGYAFIERVRSRPPALGGRVPALALTAYVGDDARRKAESAGFDMHVGKPVVPGELLGKIAMLVGRSIAVPSQAPAAIRSPTAERRRDWDA